MSFHPDDDLLDLIDKVQEEYEQEMKSIEETFEDLKKTIEPLKQAPIAPEFLEALDGVLLLLAQVGKNRVEIRKMRTEMLELHLLQKREIDDIYDRFAGLGKHR